ncbi:uncharacterized protein LOC131880039 [Tigriopus californicus]|uniref:uncharacterized protein LOC131880039 n=1 Tax=Tigriopus californicus TaxID=6832 RepID=UPI0027DA5937|nr:uncharacterized protein LOC131880039 [Tigriopus californicus]
MRKNWKQSCVWTLLGLQTVLVVYLGIRIQDLSENFKKIRNDDRIETLRTLKELQDSLSTDAQCRENGEVVKILEEKVGPQNGLQCGNNVPEDQKLVCDEHYDSGQFRNSELWGQGSWRLQTDNCHIPNPDWSELITVVLMTDHYGDQMELETKFMDEYPNIRVILATTKDFQTQNQYLEVLQVKEFVPVLWKTMINRAQTPFVLVGWDLFSITPWSELERSVRLLQEPWIGVVGGSVRNLTGYWTTPCYQAEIHNYQLRVRPGYGSSSCDCMKCDILNGVPFMAKKEVFHAVPLVPDLPDTPAMFIQWFLDLFKTQWNILLCPDIMYFTYMSPNWFLVMSKESWQQIAIIQQIQGIHLNQSLIPDYSFTSEEVNLICDVGKLQKEAKLLPWGCQEAYAHILRTLLKIEERLETQFELTSGSLLGALKLGHFLPWDIDGDIYFSTEDFYHFSTTEGKGQMFLKHADISIYGIQDDNYSDKGAGYFKLGYKGIEVEMSGVRGSISLPSVAQVTSVATKIFVAGVWFRCHANPGRYARSRYGPQYLRHAQSWRYNGMSNAYDKYNTAFWNLCETPGHHACLEHYPNDGNLMFHPSVFQAWNEVE